MQAHYSHTNTFSKTTYLNESFFFIIPIFQIISTKFLSSLCHKILLICQLYSTSLKKGEENALLDQRMA